MCKCYFFGRSQLYVLENNHKTHYLTFKPRSPFTKKKHLNQENHITHCCGDKNLETRNKLNQFLPKQKIEPKFDCKLMYKFDFNTS